MVVRRPTPSCDPARQNRSEAKKTEGSFSTHAPQEIKSLCEQIGRFLRLIVDFLSSAYSVVRRQSPPAASPPRAASEWLHIAPPGQGQCSRAGGLPSAACWPPGLDEQQRGRPTCAPREKPPPPVRRVHHHLELSDVTPLPTQTTALGAIVPRVTATGARTEGRLALCWSWRGRDAGNHW